MSGDPTPIPYVPEQHYAQVLRWFELFGETIFPEVLPPTGLIIPGVAAGFLYRTDSSLAMIESLVANREAPKEERTRAIDAIIVGLSREAQKQGFKTVLGFTQLDAVVQRVHRLGWSSMGEGFKLVSLQLDTLR